MLGWDYDSCRRTIARLLFLESRCVLGTGLGFALWAEDARCWWVRVSWRRTSACLLFVLLRAGAYWVLGIKWCIGCWVWPIYYFGDTQLLGSRKHCLFWMQNAKNKNKNNKIAKRFVIALAVYFILVEKKNCFFYLYFYQVPCLFFAFRKSYI